MTLVRVVDYVASPGGGCRFTAEMLRALRRTTQLRFEVVSHGEGLATYQRLLRAEFTVRDLAPLNAFRSNPPWHRRPGARLINAVLRTPDFHFDVPGLAFEGCDVVWLPWMQRHRIPWDHADRVVATLHDLINVEFPGVVSPLFRKNEMATLSSWLASPARIIVDADATVAAIERVFGPTAARPTVVPLSSEHGAAPPSGSPRAWPFAGSPYVLCPSNVSPHKNLDVVIDAFGLWKTRHRLVITGFRTDIWSHGGPRHRALRRMTRRSRLVRGRDVFALGYVDVADYDALLRNAWAVVIPTLAEGYGFPIVEAMYRGIPVLSSDIPVLRELVARARGEVIWFDPRSPADLAEKLATLEERYDSDAAAAKAQVRHLVSRSWDDVAAEYAVAFERAPEVGRTEVPDRGDFGSMHGIQTIDPEARPPSQEAPWTPPVFGGGAR